MENDDVRLDKYLANNGFGSRSEVKKLIASGRITVDGVTVTECDFRVDAQNVIAAGMPDGIGNAGKPVTQAGTENTPETVGKPGKYLYYMLNKPAGCITAASDPKCKTVMDLFPKNRRSGLNPVGRLDKDAEGLLIITDDGKLNHFLTSPKRNVSKKYFARLKGIPDGDGIKKLREGVAFKDFTSRPALLEVISADEAAGISEVCFTVTEGRFHEVKRLAISIGCEVQYLKRVGFGGLELDEGLKAGEFRELETPELEVLLKNAGIDQNRQ